MESILAGKGSKPNHISSCAAFMEESFPTNVATGSHPALVDGLHKHDQLMKAQIGQAERIRTLQITNINLLFECEKKQAMDEEKVGILASATVMSLSYPFFSQSIPFVFVGAA